jgi:hypothetical protein
MYTVNDKSSPHQREGERAGGSNNSSSIKRGEPFMIDDISEFEIMNSTKTEGILAPLPPPHISPGRYGLGKISKQTITHH